MSSTKEDIKSSLEAKHDIIIPAKTKGFDIISIKVDLSDFDDEKQTLVIEAFSGQERIAYMERPGGPREQTNIVGDRISNPDTLIFETSSNKEYKSEIIITTTLKGGSISKQPFEVNTR